MTMRLVPTQTPGSFVTLFESDESSPPAQATEELAAQIVSDVNAEMAAEASSEEAASTETAAPAIEVVDVSTAPRLTAEQAALVVTEKLNLGQIDAVLHRTISVLDRTDPANQDHHRGCLIGAYIELIGETDRARHGATNQVDDVYGFLTEHLDMVEATLAQASAA